MISKVKTALRPRVIKMCVLLVGMEWPDPTNVVCHEGSPNNFIRKSKTSCFKGSRWVDKFKFCNDKAASGFCVWCKKGEHQPLAGQTSCTPNTCPGGKYDAAAVDVAQICQDCPPGKYSSPESGMGAHDIVDCSESCATNCVKCADAFFGSTCLVCGNNKFLNLLTQQCVDKDRCPPGFTASPGATAEGGECCVVKSFFGVSPYACGTSTGGGTPPGSSAPSPSPSAVERLCPAAWGCDGFCYHVNPATKTYKCHTDKNSAAKCSGDDTWCPVPATPRAPAPAAPPVAICASNTWTWIGGATLGNDFWCQSNCLAGYCPPTDCTCVGGVTPAPAPGADTIEDACCAPPSANTLLNDYMRKQCKDTGCQYKDDACSIKNGYTKCLASGGNSCEPTYTSVAGIPVPVASCGGKVCDNLGDGPCWCDPYVSPHVCAGKCPIGACSPAPSPVGGPGGGGGGSIVGASPSASGGAARLDASCWLDALIQVGGVAGSISARVNYGQLYGDAEMKPLDGMFLLSAAGRGAERVTLVFDATRPECAAMRDASLLVTVGSSSRGICNDITASSAGCRKARVARATVVSGGVGTATPFEVTVQLPTYAAVCKPPPRCPSGRRTLAACFRCAARTAAAERRAADRECPIRRSFATTAR